MAPRSDVRFIDIRNYVRGLQEKGEFTETIYRVGVRDIVEAERSQVDKFVQMLREECGEQTEDDRCRQGAQTDREITELIHSLVLAHVYFHANSA
uniref:Uncharacterized protein n=1 Tax=Noccaea caerulescens TaxID=107243 RepID=A0A1J3HMV7_NOCCA